MELVCQTDIDRSAQAIGFTALAGLSADAVPKPSELTISRTAGRFTIPAFANMRILFARATIEPNITEIVDVSDSSRANQIGAWSKYASAVTLLDIAYNVWVSNQVLSSPVDLVLEIG